MATQLVRGNPTTEIIDPVRALARALLYFGLFFSSQLVLRVDAITVGDLLLLLSCAGAIISSALRADKPAPSALSKIATTVLTCLIVIGGALSTVSAIQPDGSLAVVGRILFLVLVLPWLARVLLESREHLAAATAWTAAGAAFAASGTLLQYVFGPNIIPGSEVTQAGRFTGWTGHVSDLGGIGALGVAIGIGFVISGRLVHRAWGILAVTLAAVGLVLSGSVSGMLAAGVALLIYLIRGALRIRYVLLIGVLMAAIYSVSSIVQSNTTGALNPVDRLLQTLGITEQGRYSTTESRFETTDAAFASIAKHPFVGVGLDPISSIADGEFPVHNLVIGALFQGGLLLAIGITAFAVRPLLGRWLRDDPSLLTTQLLATAVAAFVFAMTAPSLYNRYFWIPIALLCVARARHAVTGQPRVRTESSLLLETG